MNKILVFFVLVLFNLLVYGQNYKTQISIIYTNSANGYLESCDCPSLPYGGLARRITVINQLRGKNSVVVDSGDLLPAEENKLLTEYCLRLVEYCNYDAVNIGDQEIIQGLNFVKQFKDIPFITTNVISKKDTFLFPRYIVKEVNNIKIAIVGVVSVNTLTLLEDSVLNDIKILEYTNCINNLIPLLRKEVDLIVLLSHCGLEEDKQIAKQINGINIIVGGHSQDLILQPIRIGSTLIVQAGKDGSYVGKLDLQIEKTGKGIKIYRYKNKLVLLDKKVPVKKEIQEIITEYNHKLKQQAEKFLLK
jgi:5'-nucleotidase